MREEEKWKFLRELKRKEGRRRVRIIIYF